MSDNQPSLYDVLGVAPNAPVEVIRAAYRVLARLHHPDASAAPQDAAKMSAINQAYEVLSDPSRRARYDASSQPRAGAFRPSDSDAQWRAADQAREQAERRRAEWAAAQAAANERKRAAEREAAEARERLRAEAEERRAAAAAAEAQRQEHARSMHPVARVVYLHRGITAAVAALALAGAILAIAVPTHLAAARAEEEDLARASAISASLAADRSASASATSASSAAASSASASAASASVASEAAASASASNAAAAAASAQAAKEAAVAAARRKSCLAGARADERNLSGCDLSNADLTGRSLARRDLSNANLSGAKLKGAIFDKALLQGVRWEGAQCPDGTSADQVGGTCEKNMLHRGDLLRPARFGQSVRVGEWQVEVVSIQANAKSNAAAVEDYNIEPGRGYVYAIVRLNATYEGTGQGAASELNLEINGVSEDSSDVHCMLMDTDLYDPLTTGRSRSFRSCIYMLASKTTHGSVRVIDGYSFESDAPSAYWAVP